VIVELIGAYRRVLALPRVRSTILLMLVARLPMTAMGVLMTLYVVGPLGRGYGEAGLVGTATTLGTVVGAPVVGRMLDRHGLRRVVACCGACSMAFWLAAPHLPYAALAALAAAAGAIALPAGSLTRQFLAALVPEDQRRAVYSLDTILAEASFIIGPATGVLVSTQLSAALALTGIGVWIGLTSLVLCAVDLPIRGPDDARPDPAARRANPLTHLHAGLAAALLVTAGALFTLIGTELSLVAVLRANGEAAWTGVVIAMMSVASIAGGIVHGAVRRSFSLATLSLLLGLLVLPVGLMGRSWWLLGIALAPMNLMCTPTLAAGAELVSRISPAHARGEVMGLLDSASRLGIALGAPVVGLAIDHTSPGWGFAAAGTGGLLLTAVGALGQRRARASDRSASTSEAEAVT
jgi:predicted MFS family arabinose efflux permease